MPAGAPRTVSLPPDDMIALGHEMIKWIEEHPDILHLSEWYSIEKMFTYDQWKTFKIKPEFVPYYEKAIKMVGRKYLDKTSNVREGVSQRWQRHYFQDLVESEDDQARFESSLRKEEAKEVSSETNAKMDAILDQVTQNQEAFKSSRKSSKDESKS